MGKTQTRFKQVTGRVQSFVGDDDRYFPGATYQGVQELPSSLKSMLDHDLIDVFLDVDVRDMKLAF